MSLASVGSVISRPGLGFGLPLVLLWFAPVPALAGGAASGISDAAADALFSPVPAAEAHWTPVGPTAVDNPFVDIDWSVLTSGAFIADNSGGRFQTTVAPTLTVTRPGARLDLSGTAAASLSRTGDAPVNVDELRLSGTANYAVGPGSSLDSDASLTVTQESPFDPDVASDVATTPVEYAGKAESAYKSQFGRLGVTLRGSIERDVYGPTTLTDGSNVDNTSLDNTQFGTGLRLGYQITPVFEVFGDSQVLRTGFDAASTGLGVKLDGTQYALTAGIAAHWGERLSASVSAGVGVEHFDDASLADVRQTLYDANISYKPTDVLTLAGDLSTTITPPGPDGTGTARVGTQATAAATYLVNDWLDWRASANWHDARYADTSDTDRGYGFGVGADYLLNRQMKLSADYGFDRSTVSPSPAEDTHTVTVGLTVQK